MKLEIPPLPYANDALEPHIGARTVETHYEKHHKGYLAKLQKALGRSEKPESLSNASSKRAATSSTSPPRSGTTPSTGGA